MPIKRTNKMIEYLNTFRGLEKTFSLLRHIEWQFKEIFDLVGALEKELKYFEDSQLQDDFRNIQNALNKFSKLMRLSAAAGEEKLLDSEYLRGVRHEMRSSIGTIMGYSELIQDTLDAIPSSRPVVEITNKLIIATTDVLALLESLRPHENELSLEENDADILNYAPLFYRGHILIIDKNTATRDILRRKVAQIGHDVVAFQSGAQAFDFLKDNPIDLILLDFFGSELDGYQFLVKLKESQNFRTIPVIVIVSSCELETALKCIRGGAEDYLPTPVNNTLLQTRINACLLRKIIQEREQKTLQKLEQTYHSLEKILEAIEGGAAFFDKNEVFIFCNTSFRALYPSIKILGGKGFTYLEFLRENLNQGFYFLEGGASLENYWIQTHLNYYHTASSYKEKLSSGMVIEVSINKLPMGGTIIIHKKPLEDNERPSITQRL